MNTLLLDRTSWDLLLDINGNIAVASEPYSLAQDAASAIQTFQGECYYDTSLGIPYFAEVLGKSPSLPLLKTLFTQQALAVPDVTAAQCFISAISRRVLQGQVQITSVTGQTTAANFVAVNPQGA